MAGYDDGSIICDGAGITIRRYYFPWGTRHLAYGSVRLARRVDLGALTGRARIWGTSNPRYWANLDMGRFHKSVGFVLDVGRFVRPFITPDDPEGFERALRDRGIEVVRDERQPLV